MNARQQLPMEAPLRYQPGFEQVEETEDRVTRPDAVEVPAHGTTQALATDTAGQPIWLNHGGCAQPRHPQGCG